MPKVNEFFTAGLVAVLLFSALVLCGCLSSKPASSPREFNTQNTIQHSTVKILMTMQKDNFSNPWQASRPVQGSGTGFIIQGKRILTNAHVISDARFIEVQKNGDPKRYIAQVRFAGHDCDLAILEIIDPGFFENTTPVEFADELPTLGDSVTAIGFPLGGSRVSITRGVVSRIDYSLYSHSAVDQHLVLQVDAAINPGNSGGPILFNGKVVGVAFQGLSRGDNIGYAIPVPVIRHFLADIADEFYNGYPELGALYMELRNPAMRKSLQVPHDENGVVVTRLDPFGSAFNILQTGDVLLAIDGLNIAEDGSVELEGNTVEFSELLERKQSGDTANLRVFRGGNILDIAVPLMHPVDPFVFRNLYDISPEYAVFGGLVFAPLNREILKTIRGGFSTPNEQNLLYLSEYAKVDNQYRNADEFVILIRRLPHPVSTYADPFVNGYVTSVNDISIRNLRDLVTAFEKPIGAFHVIRFDGTDDPLILNAEAVRKSQSSILQQYGVPAPFHTNNGPSE